jgi:hypothetical protein
VAALDRASLRARRPVTLPLARAVLLERQERRGGGDGGVTTTGTPERLTLDEVRGRPERVVAGLMTGTSLDGIDVALCRSRVAPAGRRGSGPGGGRGVPVRPGAARPAARGGDRGGDRRRDRAARRDLGLAYADAVADLAAKAGARVELVGSHGQTVHHEHGVATLQIGEPAYLALRLGCPVVADFRQGDVAAGGCGAPLAPIIDSWLLRRPGAGVLALNLGGISNFTALPPEGDPAPVVGLDCGPANMVMDGLVHRLTAGARPTTATAASRPRPGRPGTCWQSCWPTRSSPSPRRARSAASSSGSRTSTVSWLSVRRRASRTGATSSPRRPS